MFLGYKNSANYPYEVVKYSMESALKRFKITETLKFYNLNLKSKIYPWF